MKYLLALFVLFFAGCASTSTSPSLASQILTPANIDKATKDGLTAAGQLFLANNPSYAPEVQAAADAFLALSVSNPASITATDITAALAKAPLTPKTREEIAAGATLALSIFETDFHVNLPALTPNYASFALAVAQGLQAAVPAKASP